jgi:hypothetical protein
MATHEIVISNPNKSVLYSDVEFAIKSNGRKLGTLLLSKGNVEWIPTGNSVNRHRFSWEKFAELMEGGKSQRKVAAAKNSARKVTTATTKNA